MNAFVLEMNRFPREQQKSVTWLNAYRILVFMVIPICLGITDISGIILYPSSSYFFELAVSIFYFSCFFATRSPNISAYRFFMVSIAVSPLVPFIDTMLFISTIHNNPYSPVHIPLLAPINFIEISIAIIGSITWVTLNIIYFQKRKFLFYEDPSEVFRRINVTPVPAYESVKCSNSHAQLFSQDRKANDVQNTMNPTPQVMRAEPTVPEPILPSAPPAPVPVPAPAQFTPQPAPSPNSFIQPQDSPQPQTTSDAQMFFKIKCVVKEIQGKAVFPDLQQIESFLFVYAVILQKNDDIFLAELFEEFKDTTVYKPDILKNFITQCAISYNESAAQGIDTLIDQYAKDISSVFPQIKTRNFKKYLTFLAKRIQFEL